MSSCLPTLALVFAQGEAPAQSPLGGIAMPLILGFAFVYFLIIRPQRREQQERQALYAALKKDDRVVTTGGMFGTIVNIKEDEVTLRIDDQAKVKVRFQKSAIARVLGGDGDKGADAAKSTDEPSKS